MGDLTRNFSSIEISCKCGCGRARITPDLINKLQAMRTIAGMPVTINSAVRCKAHNKAVGGSETSSHLHGEAADIKVENDAQRGVMIPAAIKAGFDRIGISKKGFIHVDVTKEKNAPRIWLYT